MNRKRLRKLQREIEKRGGTFWSSPDAPPEMTELFIQELMKCPDCRDAVVAAMREDDEDSLRMIGSRREH